MARITNYTTLKQAVIDEAEDNSQEFESFIDTAIGLAEEALIDDLEIVDVKEIATVNLVAGDKLVEKPENYNFLLDAILQENTDTSTAILEDSVLRFQTNDFIEMYWPDEAETGVPKYLGDYDEDSFLVAPTPDANYSLELVYQAIPEPLSATNEVNVLVKKTARALFAKVMEEMSLFQKAYEEANLWTQRYEARMNRINNKGMKQRRTDSNTQSPNLKTENY